VAVETRELKLERDLVFVERCQWEVEIEQRLENPTVMKV